MGRKKHNELYIFDSLNNNKKKTDEVKERGRNGVYKKMYKEIIALYFCRSKSRLQIKQGKQGRKKVYKGKLVYLFICVLIPW